jgi:chromosome segregation ATPase
MDKVEVLATGTADALYDLCDKVDELSDTVEAQERSFSKRLADALAQLTAQAVDNQALVAELCAKVQSHETQLQKLMEEREEAPVEVESSGTAVTGAPTSSLMGRAARAAARATGLSR